LPYLDEGAGKPVVLVHGNPTWSFQFRNVIKALRGTHRCIAPDWAAAFPAARVEKLPDCGHFVSEENPQALIGAITRA
jgi:haloalkane dehalogenase